jgi:adenylate cyclase
MTPALTSYLARDYDRAVRELQTIIEMDPNFVVAHSVLGNVYVQQGLYEKAMAQYQRVLELSKGVAVVETAMKAVMGHAYARWGKRNKALKMLDEIEKASCPSPHSIAEVHAALGQTDQAFEWLNKAFDQHDMQMVSMKTNPTLDGLRSDPRFAELVRRVGLPQ